MTLSRQQLAALMPMHLALGPDGHMRGAGRTMRKLIAAAGVDPADDAAIDALFTLTRPLHPAGGLAALIEAAQGDRRVFLRVNRPPWLTLRGHVISDAEGGLFVNLGFGITLPEAVRALGLTDSDFAPSELAMELLFLHEANQAVMTELSRFNLRLEEAREAAELQAFTDPLTGLFNRRGLDLALGVALRGEANARRDGDPGGFALAHLDLDRFKEVNDRLGHAAGDEVLRRVARVLRRETRAADTAARVGGDEFVLILMGMSSPEALDRLSRRIIAGIEEPIVIAGETCAVSASLGIVLSGTYAVPDADAMLADADAALYASKNAGRGRATLHAPSD